MDKELRQLILKRDEFKCTECNCNKLNRLHVHHKDINRQNNHPENLITLCVVCHAEKHPKNYHLLLKKLNKKIKNKHRHASKEYYLQKDYKKRIKKWEIEDKQLTEQFKEKFGYENIVKRYNLNDVIKA